MRNVEIKLTRAFLHAGGTEAKLFVLVRFGLEGHRVIDTRQRAVVLARSTVIDVTASLDQRGRAGDFVYVTADNTM